MTRDEQEMALWRRVAMDEGFGFADEAVAAFRKRYPPQIDKDAYAKGWILFLAMAGIGLAAFFAIAFAMAWI